MWKRKKQGLSRKDKSKMDDLKHLIVIEAERICSLKENQCSMGAINYDKDRVQTTPSNPLENYICELDRLEHRLNALQDELFLMLSEQVVNQTISGGDVREYREYLPKIYRGYFTDYIIERGLGGE